MNQLNVGIFIFDGVEILDFAGPFEVFSRTRLDPGIESRRTEESAPFRVFAIAATSQSVTTTGGLRVEPHYSFSSDQPIDLLLIPGGFGTRPLLDDAATIEWIRRTTGRVKHLTSVCTGALLLAKAGLLRNRRATTHWGALELLASLDPTIQVERSLRVVQDGVITSAGVSAGIDMAFQVVESICGKAVADETAHSIEFRRT